jgi:predicted nucleotidyltransferase
MSASSYIPEEWMQALISWANDNERVSSAYLYGSRVMGTHEADSDLDIAIRLDGNDEDPFTTWAFEADAWRNQLAELLPVAVHLELAQDDDAVVWPAVLEHGIEIFRRT